jgi:sugar phosphate isomerase/epimerase
MSRNSGLESSSPGLFRRNFLWSTLGTIAALAGGREVLGLEGKQLSAPSGGKDRIAFNTANLVARVSHYRFELSHWMEQHKKTIEATDEAAWRAICREIAATGFKAVEIWEAHASPEVMSRERARLWRSILKESGLNPIAYAGTLRRESLQVAAWLETPHIEGGLGSLDPAQATRLCGEFKIGFNYENHPEKNIDEILKKIGGGNQWLGVCVDTGWLGTQGVPAPAAIKALGPLVRHVHIKDVKAAGKHETCLLGEGVVNVAGCLKALREIGYAGWYSWEDEPEDRNPFDSAIRNRQWIEKQLSA